MADINIQEVTTHINIETANGYNLEFNGPVVNMNVVLSNYYTKTETDALLNGKADKADTYTKSETNILLNDKANKADTYTISQINGMVQDINTAVDTKQNLITGAASTITNSNLTANRAVISNASGKAAVSNVTSTELGYLSGVTSGVQTQLNNKASTSLNNLSADGQMIIDTANGTISNCILEIPQNIKMTLENNVLTKKAGSTTVLYGETYKTQTNNSDISRTLSGLSEGKYVIFDETSNSLATPRPIGRVYSGTEFPTLEYNSLNIFYNVSEKKLYGQTSTGWTEKTSFSYPLCIVDVDSLGNVSFAKDSNGNDMIFNGAGFIGHHAFVYPNVKVLIPDGLNADGSLKSAEYTLNSLNIEEIASSYPNLFIKNFGSSNTLRVRGYHIVNTYDEINIQSFHHYYVKSENKMYRAMSSTTLSEYGSVNIVNIEFNGTTVTDFAIRQPVRMATVEMLNSALGDIETLLAAI